MGLRERIKKAIPTKEEAPAFVTSFVLPLIFKTLILPGANVAGALWIAEEMRKDPTLMYLGILTYALYNAAYVSWDYRLLIRDRVAGSAKANTLYRVATAVWPENHRSNAALAQVGTFLMNVVGINPDWSAPLSTVLSVVQGDPTIAIAQRVSDIVVGAPSLLLTAGLWFRKGKRGRNP